MRSKNRSFEEVVKDPTYDQKNLSETLTSAKAICTQEPYISTNTGLCSTLKEKLTESIGAGAVPQEDQDQNFISGVDEKLNPETFDQNVSQVTGNYVDFEKRCIDEKGDLKEEVQGCAEELNQILSDLEKVDRHEAQINEELNGQENQPEQLNNQNCENCGPDQSNIQNIAKKQEVKKQKTYACTPEQYKRKKERECGWNWKMLTTGPSCSLNMLTSILKSLWGSVKAIVGLIWDGVKYVGNKLVQGAKWVAGLFGYEDESSKKVAAASRTSNKAIDEFKKDPFSAAVTFFKEIYNSLADYVANDVACEDWSGIPHMSKCLRPATSWECQPCLDRIDTVCSAIGVVAAEVIPAVFTGGASAALKGAGLGAKVAGIVGKMGKLGKLTRLESKLAKTLKISKVAGKTEDVSKITARISKLKTGASITGDLTKSQKILGKIYNVSRWPTAKYKKIKFAYYRAKTALKAFKSTKFGGIKSTIDRLRNIRDQYYVLRAGSWVVKNSVKAVYNTTVKLPVKIALSPITVPLKTSKGFIKLQSSANKVGFKVSDAIIDQSYKTTSWVSKKAFNKTLVRSSVGQVYNPMLRDFASKVVTYGTVAKVPYRMKIAVDKTAEKAIFKFKTDEELSIEAKNYNMNTKDYKSYIRILYSGDEPTEADRKTISNIALKQGYPVEMLIGQSVEVRLLEAATCNEVHFSEYDYQNYAIYSGIETKEAKKQIQADLYQSKKDCGN